MLIAIGHQTKPVVAPSFPTITGGELFSDSTYYYRAFKTSGDNLFTVSDTSLAVEMLSVGGGGAGLVASSGGGGAGAGSVDFTSLTLTPGQYNAYVGAPTLNTALNDVTNSSVLFTSYAGGDGDRGVRGASTGGASGASTSRQGGAYTWNQAPGHIGNAGGANFASSNSGYRAGGGGGGAGGPGQNAPANSNGGNGGVGLSTYSDICAVVGIGENVGGVYYLGGGGGGAKAISAFVNGNPGYGNGAPNTGGGGTTGSSSRRTPGYSGVIVLRYLKTAVGG